MKALNRISNKHLTLFLFGVLALNISWMNYGMNSGDFASVTVGGRGSKICPDLKEGLALASKADASGGYPSVTVPCKDKSNKGIDVQRSLYITVEKTEFCKEEQSDLIVDGAASCTKVSGLTYHVITEVGTEASNCATCSESESQTLSATVAFPVSINALTAELGEAIDEEMTGVEKSILEAAKQEMLDEEAERELNRLAENCEILESMPLEDFRAAQETGDFGANKLEGEDRMSCFTAKLATMDTEERNDFFYTKIMPFLQEQLVSTEAGERKDALNFLNRLGKSSGMRGVDRGAESLNLAKLGAYSHSQIGQLKKLQAQNPDDVSVKMRLDLMATSINAQFGILAQNAPLGDYLGEVAGSWNGVLQQQLGTDPYTQGLLDLSTFSYSGNRWERVLEDTRQYTMDQITSAQTYINTNDSSSPLAKPTTGQQIVSPPSLSGRVQF